MPTVIPLVSIVIPCYNSGQYLPEALASVEASDDGHLHEVIIVNDGSTDLATLTLLAQLEQQGYAVLHQLNMGPAAARNTGVRFAQAEYILFLDSDNMIRPYFIGTALALFARYPAVGVVHGQPNFFGDDVKSRFLARPFDRFSILSNNYIDICSMMRKDVWQEVGGLDEERLLIGHEDWDFWIRVSMTAWEFYFVKQILFDYRVSNHSLVAQANQGERYSAMRRYIYQKHWQLVADAYAVLDQEYHAYKHDKSKPLRSFVKFLHAKMVIKSQS